eukprot:6173237-Pleurochrysis_carterae.AAC.2
MRTTPTMKRYLVSTTDIPQGRRYAETKPSLFLSHERSFICGLVNPVWDTDSAGHKIRAGLMLRWAAVELPASRGARRGPPAHIMDAVTEAPLVTASPASEV